MKPYIISHMMESVDGRIDCDMTEQIDPSNAYYDALDQLDCPTLLEGRVTIQKHFAHQTFKASDTTPIGKESFHMAVRSTGYAIAIDTRGKLLMPSDMHDGKPLLVIVSETCPLEYVDDLTQRGISWIATGRERINLRRAVEVLNTEFGVERMAVVGGGHINGAFLEAGLIDEVSVMIGPGIDGRAGFTSIFDGIKDEQKAATLLKLNSIDHIGDTVWLRYAFRKH